MWAHDALWFVEGGLGQLRLLENVRAGLLVLLQDPQLEPLSHVGVQWVRNSSFGGFCLALLDLHLPIVKVRRLSRPR